MNEFGSDALSFAFQQTNRAGNPWIDFRLSLLGTNHMVLELLRFLHSDDDLRPEYELLKSILSKEISDMTQEQLVETLTITLPFAHFTSLQFLSVISMTKINYITLESLNLVCEKDLVDRLPDPVRKKCHFISPDFFRSEIISMMNSLHLTGSSFSFLINRFVGMVKPSSQLFSIFCDCFCDRYLANNPNDDNLLSSTAILHAVLLGINSLPKKKQCLFFSCF